MLVEMEEAVKPKRFFFFSFYFLYLISKQMQEMTVKDPSNFVWILHNSATSKDFDTMLRIRNRGSRRPTGAEQVVELNRPVTPTNGNSEGQCEAHWIVDLLETI